MIKKNSLIHASPRNIKNLGFTLTELLVVMLIIGMLAAISVPQYFRIMEKTKLMEAYAYCDIIKTEQEQYLAKTGNYCIDMLPENCHFNATLPHLKYFDLPQPMRRWDSGGTLSWIINLHRINWFGPSGTYDFYAIGGSEADANTLWIICYDDECLDTFAGENATVSQIPPI